MKYIATAALVLNLGVACVDAQQKPVKMTFSGTDVPSASNLASSTADATFAGDGSLGPFTYREISGGPSTPQPSSTCTGPTHVFFTITTGAGVFRFQDGGLMTVKITRGGICVDTTVPEGHVTATYQITGGTGRFQNASGTLVLTVTAKPLLFAPSGLPVLVADTGEFAGTVAF